MQWFKMFTEARNDAKLRSLTAEQHRVWFRLLCFAAEQPERGLIAGHQKYLVAVEVADGNLELLIETCNALEVLQGVTWCYIDESRLQIRFTNFGKRQQVKPADTPERVKSRVAKSRERKRNGNTPGCNTPVTPCNTPVTPRNTLDKELDTETDTESSPYIAPPSGPETTHAHSGNGFASSPQREPADMAEVNAAMELLGKDLRTQSIAAEIGRAHNSTLHVGTPGWKWHRAARKLLEQPGSKQTFKYLLGIVGNLGDEEREEKPAKARETAAQRKRREFVEQLEAMKVRRAKERQAEAIQNGQG